MNNFGRTSNRIIFTHNNTGTLSYTYRPGGQLSCHEKYSGGLERAAETLRLPGTIINRTPAARFLLPPFFVSCVVSDCPNGIL